MGAVANGIGLISVFGSEARIEPNKAAARTSGKVPRVGNTLTPISQPIVERLAQGAADVAGAHLL